LVGCPTSIQRAPQATLRLHQRAETLWRGSPAAETTGKHIVAHTRVAPLCTEVHRTVPRDLSVVPYSTCRERARCIRCTRKRNISCDSVRISAKALMFTRSHKPLRRRSFGDGRLASDGTRQTEAHLEPMQCQSRSLTSLCCQRTSNSIK
jgi:hypothetical protein